MPISKEKKTHYPKDWKTRSRFIRLYRAKNKCEWCGAENHKPHPITGSNVILTVAHIFDKNPESSHLLNLAALCQKCHNAHDVEDRQKNIRQTRQRKNKESIKNIQNTLQLHSDQLDQLAERLKQ